MQRTQRRPSTDRNLVPSWYSAPKNAKCEMKPQTTMRPPMSFCSSPVIPNRPPESCTACRTSLAGPVKKSTS